MKKILLTSKVHQPQVQQKTEKNIGMTEEQVKNIVKNCNAQLKSVTEETDQLKNEYSLVEKNISLIQHDIQEINLDYENIKVDAIHSEKLCALLKKYDEEMQLIQQAYYFEGNQEILNCPKLNSIDFMIKEMEKSQTSDANKQTIMVFLQDTRNKIIGNLIQEEKINLIEKISSKYAEEFESMKKALSTTTFCTNCKELFVPEQNHETACFYHLGKLKYFSCRSCGADDYYTCCLKCSRCCIGCATSAHVP